LEVKRTSQRLSEMSAFDPKRTSAMIHRDNELGGAYGASFWAFGCGHKAA
jgi:hypothetical protein